MRLIDADKLPYVNKVILVDKSDGDIIVTIAKEYTSYVNDETPTVEAIPIEWIKKQIEEWKNWGPEGLSDDEWEYGTCLETLLENWEKENEIDRCR